MYKKFKPTITVVPYSTGYGTVPLKFKEGHSLSQNRTYFNRCWSGIGKKKREANFFGKIQRWKTFVFLHVIINKISFSVSELEWPLRIKNIFSNSIICTELYKYFTITDKIGSLWFWYCTRTGTGTALKKRRRKYEKPYVMVPYRTVLQKNSSLTFSSNAPY